MSTYARQARAAAYTLIARPEMESTGTGTLMALLDAIRRYVSQSDTP
jgi:hypothetical protein